MRTLVIIPTYNERENLPIVVEGVLATDQDIDILVVDDGSPDGTGDIADALATTTDGRVQVFHRTSKQGLGTAYLAGFRHAIARRYDYVVEMDADLSHRPEDLPRLLDAVRTADVIVGSRHVAGGRVIGWSLARQLISRAGSLYAKLLLGLPISDCTSGFKCFRRGALERLNLEAVTSNGFAFQVEMNYACAQAGLRLVEVPIVFPNRTRGKSKISKRIVVEAAEVVVKLRWASVRTSARRAGRDRMQLLANWRIGAPGESRSQEVQRRPYRSRSLSLAEPGGRGNHRTRPGTTRPLRILQIASEGPPTRSGIARFVQQLQVGLQRRGHEINIVSYPGVSRLTVGEVRLYGLLFALPRLAREIRGYDVVHLHGSAPSFSDVFLLFARALRAFPPLVYTHHCDIHVEQFGLLNNLYNRLHHRLSNWADQTVSTSSSYAAELSHDRVSVIPQGVDPAFFTVAQKKDAEFCVLFVGQFRPYKGVPILLQAMANMPESHLLLVGQGPEEEKYRALATDLGVRAEFHINPTDLELRGLYARAHVIALPSVTRAEAFGLVLLEGMAAGCVPVASDLPGVREVLGRIGFTFPAGSVDGLARRLRELRDRPELLQQVSDRSRVRAAEYTWERNIAQYEHIYTDLVAVRQLQLATQTPLVDPLVELRKFFEQVAQSFDAQEFGVFIGGPDGDLRLILSPSVVSPGQELHLLARYSHVNGESALVTPESAPRPLAHILRGYTGSLLSVPLRTNGRQLGAVVIQRQRPFDDIDVRRLVGLASNAASVVTSSGAFSDWFSAEQQSGYGTRWSRVSPRFGVALADRVEEIA